MLAGIGFARFSVLADPSLRRSSMKSIKKYIDVNVPVPAVYNQWTQFEEFPKFMENIESVHQLDETGLHWVAKIAGVKVEWDAEISEPVPDKRIAWYGARGPVR